ncbi:MAG: hypothetical protein H7A51_16375 [Akkermansiaceae bacterium]|nr:hypothetical protein [Akkermansiaceae bacterium]
MKKAYTYIATTLLALSVLPTSVSAQTDDSTSDGNTSETTGPRRFWQASVPGGNYVVALDRISSVSKHTYIIDGNLSVTEVVVDTNGNSLVRFYYIEPVGSDASNVGARVKARSQEILERAGQRTGVDVNSAVMKQYPTTTHAKTVEFRVSDAGDLDKLYGSVLNAWVKGTGRKFTIKIQ